MTGLVRRTAIVVGVMALCATGAFAELQNVEIGGAISIGGWYYNYDSLPSSAYMDQWTRLHVKADFTDEVSALIEFDNYSVWGEDFRSAYLTGADGRGNGDTDLYQAYIEAKNLWGTPLTLKAGRQEIMLGDEFLIGNNSMASPLFGLSFDALRLTYGAETFSVDAIAAKLAEGLGDFGKDDTDLYAVYFSYTGVEDHVFDAYWMYVRDDASATAFEVDLHTLGLRAAGAFGAFDYSAEAAWQLGGADGLPGAFGFDEADTDYDTPGATASVGYTFDTTWTPRVYAAATWLDGGDPDDSLWSNDRTLPFNRLFSDVDYTSILAFTDMSNVRWYALGVEVAPTDAVGLFLQVAHLEADELAPRTGGFLFGTGPSSRQLGWEAAIGATYQYSEDLSFALTYAHFFGDDGLEGNNILGNGLRPWAGDGDDEYDTVFANASLSF
ncbi:MAG TPA: alginate export family protein [Candidatus Hydrogenedentes bacterium]|nr:alginate export family protein [Candidatus Hydrogenedentota bacterium]HOC71188.1 alginate export family protein [Candidatus Hydrogenedentota bacterium]HOH49174.1 alginate export family protein [Candidatus Hydrogenedentota bacterium]HPA41033.1 alginate export family protein [Candidatus Hydrogenedentota bacterium]HQL95890.1 alginate export family protein [Candidatus Hydrogenedentota bacterium]